jgi:cation:H+ antiporter
MLLHALLFLVGIGLLYIGAEGLIQGASSLALRYGIRPGLIGLTVVALGTSMPEFLVNLFAVFSSESSLALGNIVGSNISNVALILGCSALVVPLTISPQILRREYPVMLGVMVLFYACALDGVIGTIDGLLMVGLLLTLGAYLIYDARRASSPLVEQIEPSPEDVQGALAGWKKAAYLLGGSVALAVGAHFLVESAKWTAHQMNIDPMVIGLTILAVGTSLPELAASLVSALREEADLSVGNVMGSNLLNVLFVVGTISIFDPLEVGPLALRVDFPVMLGFCALLFPITWYDHRISRWGGGVLLAGFAGYMTYLLFPFL